MLYLMTELRKVLDEKQNPIKPTFRAGDTVSVYMPLIQKGKEVNKVFTGVCIRARKNTFAVRKVIGDDAVEINFSCLAPSKVEIDRFGTTRRSRIYYWRDLSGKKARIAEDFKRKAKSK